MKTVKIKKAKDLKGLFQEGKLEWESSDCGLFNRLIYRPGGPKGCMEMYLPYGPGQELLVVEGELSTINSNTVTAIKELLDD